MSFQGNFDLKTYGVFFHGIFYALLQQQKMQNLKILALTGTWTRKALQADPRHWTQNKMYCNSFFFGFWMFLQNLRQIFSQQSFFYKTLQLLLRKEIWRHLTLFWLLRLDKICEIGQELFTTFAETRRDILCVFSCDFAN